VGDVETLLKKIEQAAVLGFDVEYTSPTIKLPGQKAKPDALRAKLHGFAIAYLLPGERKPGSTYVPVRHEDADNADSFDVARIIDALLEAADRGIRVWAHNASAELQTCMNAGFINEGTHCMFHDSMVAVWLLGNLDEDGNEKRKGDDKLALKFLRVKMLGKPERPDFQAITKGQPLETVALSVVAPYCRHDAVDCLELGEYAWARLPAELQRHMVELDQKCIEPIRAMEAAGMAVDTAALSEAAAEWSKRCDEIRAEFELMTTTTVSLPVKVKVADGLFKNGNVKYRTEVQDLDCERGANISSSEQISKWCYDVLKVWPTEGLKRNAKGAFSTEKETLLPFCKLPGLGGELARMRLEFNKLDKLVSTYCRPMIAAPSQYADGRLHCRFKLTGTDTQRLSSSGPNLQNLPSRSKEGKAIRKAIVAPPGRKIVVVDANQAELRIAAHLSQDPELSLCYELEEDVHAGTLAMLRAMDPSFERTDAKVVNFSSLYNITARALSAPGKMNCSEERAQLALDTFYRRFPTIEAFKEWCYNFIIENGYMRTVDGFRRPISGKVVFDKILRKRALHWMSRNRGPNTAIQGSVAGIMKIAMVRLYDEWRAAGFWGHGPNQVVLICQEHDSFVAEAGEAVAERAKADMIRHVETAVKLRVPFKADGKIGNSWADCK
jgi:DNA polymerase-1